jgi:S-adenosylmethionine decarboxylase proenzyme
MKTLGRHSLIELSGCDPERLKHVREVRSAMLEAARRANGTIVKAVFHAFSPWGVSGVVVIAESHLTIHTWPEHGYAAVDVFSCSPKLRQAEVRRWLVKAFAAQHTRTLRVARGPRALAKPAPKPKSTRPPRGR